MLTDFNIQHLHIQSLIHHPDHLDHHNKMPLGVDYADRRLSTDALSEATAATDDSHVSARVGEKRSSHDEDDDDLDISPRSKRLRPSLTFRQSTPTGSPPDHGTATAVPSDDGRHSRTPELDGQLAKVSLPSISGFESSNLSLSPSSASSSSLSLNNTSSYPNPYPNFPGISRRVDQDLRRGSLPNLYSNSLGMHRNRPAFPTPATGSTVDLNASVNSNMSSMNMGMNSVGNSGLSSYQFPLPTDPSQHQHQQQNWASRSSSANGMHAHTAPSTPERASLSLGSGNPLGVFTSPPPRISGHDSSPRKSSLGVPASTAPPGTEEWFTPSGPMFMSTNGAANTGNNAAGANTTASAMSHPQTIGVQQQPAPQPSPLPPPQTIANGTPQRRRGKLPKPTTDFLKDWLHRHSDHPYPSEEEKKQLCHATGLSMSQVSNWMINARRRILAPANRAAQAPTTTVPYGASMGMNGMNNLHHNVGMGMGMGSMTSSAMTMGPGGAAGIGMGPGMNNGMGLGGRSSLPGIGMGLPTGGMGSMNGMGGMVGLGMNGSAAYPSQTSYGGHAPSYGTSSSSSGLGLSVGSGSNGGSSYGSSGYSTSGGGSAYYHGDNSLMMQRRASMPGPIPDVHHHNHSSHHSSHHSPSSHHSSHHYSYGSSPSSGGSHYSLNLPRPSGLGHGVPPLTVSPSPGHDESPRE